MADLHDSTARISHLRHAMALRHSALLRMDLRQLDEVLDGTLRYTHSNGICEDKASYLAALSSGIYRYHSIEESDVDVFELGDGAWCAGSVRMHATVKGVERHMHNRFIAVWRITPDGPRLAAYCATPVPVRQ